MRITISCVCWISMAAVPATASEDSHTIGARGTLVFSDVTHTAIEARVADFQSTSDLPYQMYLVADVGYHVSGLNIVGIECGYLAQSDITFLDEDHELEVRELYLTVWYRRMIPVMWGMRLMPGMGVGYNWPRVKVSKPGPAAAKHKEELGQSTTVLQGSGVQYAAGIGLEIKIGKRGVFGYLDYQYRFGPPISGSPSNDGAIFFPEGSEFDFEGSYYGFGVGWRGEW
ncbi:MAG: hypothetical protein OEX18_15730 [Candidatus Krumholzibacteria bacterium]|nr:hypothetical protein [Candidatus Krumholzibacteria bacterium]